MSGLPAEFRSASSNLGTLLRTLERGQEASNGSQSSGARHRVLQCLPESWDASSSFMARSRILGRLSEAWKALQNPVTPRRSVGRLTEPSSASRNFRAAHGIQGSFMESSSGSWKLPTGHGIFENLAECSNGSPSSLRAALRFHGLPKILKRAGKFCGSLQGSVDGGKALRTVSGFHSGRKDSAGLSKVRWHTGRLRGALENSESRSKILSGI